MAKLVNMTQLSPTMKEGVLVEWLKKEGDTIKPGDAIASVETDKAVMDLEAFDAGTLLKQLAQKGDKIAVGATLGVLGKTGEDISELLKGIGSKTQTKAAEKAPPAAQHEEASTGMNTPIKESTQETTPGRIKASPLAKKLAAQNGIDLTQIEGTGPKGRIVSRDLERVPRTSQTPTVSERSIIIHAAEGQRTPDTKLTVSPMRQVIAERLTHSKQTVPHFYLTRSVNITSLVTLRSQTNAGLQAMHAQKNIVSDDLPQKVSLNDYVLAATAQSLARHPEILRQFVPGKDSHIFQLGNVDLGFAVSLDEGLITPIIRNADLYSLFQIALITSELSARARLRKLKSEEYTGGGFTVTNLGMLGITSFQAVINAPEAAILAVGASERRAIETKEGTVAFGDFLSLSLACDHRVIDGATGAKFLVTLAQYLENPGLIR